ncbi:MAG: hypothetical protein AAFX76_07175 [Planctomycetota bacterium]
MQCNIDARGKAIRLIGGLAHLGLAGLLVLLWALGVLGGLWLWVALAAALGGGFMVFEARAGWCAVRAMGLKTPF